MVSYQEPIFISPGIVRQIYSSAQSLGQPQIAARLYMTAQSESLHNFPLPSGTALTWFLRYLSNEPAYSHHARRLVKEVADRCEPIPLTDRAEFITLAAESGFASSARLLWERYSSGRGGQSVAGNAAMVENLPTNRKSSGLGIKRIASPCRLLPLSPEDEKDFGSFAKLVLTRYRETKEPLRQASREDLNALARANVILGDVMEALGVLRVITDRYECPDLHDINVTLSALDPRLALKMVRRMVDVGPKPDGISFGTVIHQAARRGDLGVIIGLLRLMRETGQQPTTKTVVTVIRASVALSGTDKEAIRDNLVRALEVIMANAHSNHLATLDMGRADDAALAFGFWEQVVRPRAEWDDDAHASLRRRIAGSIRRQCEEGHIRGKDGRRMRAIPSRCRVRSTAA
ncbi:hypothetical protein F5148DRAFT_1273746 [Russula earlei]|uniref:Uncharacterized protein n=1 Tax=Russula earlei TaxID=71964 RepID=A0ACC0UMZ7_9AGAM|nr:hypothetical protein F5148DRAFT_1273746 [Russula earlei]